MSAANPLIPEVVYAFGEFRLKRSERVLERAGAPVPLAPKAMDVLVALIENRGRLMEKDALMREVWPDTFVEENSLAFNISVLRKALGDRAGEAQYIETVPKRGYRFIAEVAECKEAPEAVAAIAAAAPALAAPAKRKGWRGWIAIAAVVVVAAGASSWMWTHRGRWTGANTGSIVAAEFVNHTGDTVFDGALDQGLSVELQQAPDWTLVTEGTIRRTLRMMNRPPGTKLTPDLAREVCERTGSAAALTGSITKLGTQYVLGLRAVRCSTGDVLDDEQARVAKKEDVLASLSSLVTRFREKIGENPETRRRHDTPLPEATTPSLDALKAYSAGLKAQFTSGAKAALPFF